MEYSFDKYMDLVQAVQNIDTMHGGSMHVYVPGVGEIQDMRELEPPYSIIYEVYAMYHRLASYLAVDAFDKLVQEGADGMAPESVENLSKRLSDLQGIVAEWAVFAKTYNKELSPGGC